ncbi:MAG: glycosyltransferase [Flavobacteriales bacterium]|nr:glycosyltransferase [Flavobacteriales bacterium]
MKISIITINYNDIEGLKKTFNSVLIQDYPNIEYIVIDGDSSDGGQEFLKQNSDKLDFWVSEKDEGIYDAMNKGIAKASGEYVLFLNSGDWLVDNTVISKFANEKPYESIVYGNIIKVADDGKESIGRSAQSSDVSLFHLMFGTLTHPSSFFRRELFEKYGGFRTDYKIVSDWLFYLITIGVHKESVRYIDTNVSYFDMTGISNSNISVRNDERERALKEFLPSKLYEEYQILKQMKEDSEVLNRMKNDRRFNKLVNYYSKVFKSSFRM